MKEEFRRLPGLPNYGVSNLGRVVSLKIRHNYWKPLKHGVDPWRGDHRVSLHVRGRPIKKPVGGLVLWAFGFNPEPPDGMRPWPGHKDGDRDNLALENLFWEYIPATKAES